MIGGSCHVLSRWTDTIPLWSPLHWPFVPYACWQHGPVSSPPKLQVQIGIPNCGFRGLHGGLWRFRNMETKSFSSVSKATAFGFASVYLMYALWSSCSPVA